MNSKYTKNPKFIHNLWVKTEVNNHLLTFIDNHYEVDSSDVNDFMKMRSYCTGHNSIDEIVNKSGLDRKRVNEIVSSLNEIGLVRPIEYPLNSINDLDITHEILNRIHDIKHAIDLQGLEIKDYYTHAGNYIPRQKVDFFGV